jgi:TonB-linked SusC/RagA family outer membrane protein
MKSFLTVKIKPFQSNVLLAMKLTAAFLFLFTVHVSANGFGQSKISLKAKRTEMTTVLQNIEKQTEYRFLYNNQLQELRLRKVNIDVYQASLKDVLSIMFFRTNLQYQVMGNNLIVIKEMGDVRPPDVIVRGKVLGEAAAPLAGASVLVKGTSVGTTTDVDGSFSLSVPNNNVTLVISSVGYTEQEIALAGRNEVSVTLASSTKEMDQVVVIGYGTATKRDLTGSIAKIDGKEVADKPNVNPVASLQGKVAGLSVVPSAGLGKSPDIRIRGTISIGSVSPVYVVDGILNDNIDYLNPNDIESIEILKDPSSLAIFGVRGAGGVIAVTTKKAKAGQVLVNFNTSVGIKRLVDKIKVLKDAEQFKMLYEEENNNIGAPNSFNFTPWTGNTDWIDAVTQTGFFNNNNLSVMASSDKNRFYASVGAINEKGVVVREQLKKYLLNINDEYRFNKAIKIGFTVNYTRTESPNDGAGTLENARRIAPVVSAGTTPYKMKIYGADSAVYNLYSALPSIQNTLQNPLVTRENTWDKYIGRENRFLGSVYGEVNFLKDFNFRVAYYGDISYLRSTTYSPLYAAYDPAAQQAFFVGRQTAVTVGEENWNKVQQDYILNYKKRLGDHNIQATAGWTTYSLSDFHNWGSVKQGVSGDPIPNDKRFWYLTNGFEDKATSQSNSSQKESATTSMLVRVLYNYANKYYLNASFRRDGSSLIYNPDHRYQNFWALGGAWEISKEDFFSNVSAINFLKLKGSIGVLGNQNTYGVDYPYFPTLAQGNTAVFGPYVYPAYVNTYEVDPNLRWETVHGREVGVEFAALNNRLTGEINYYNKLTKDMLAYLDNGPKKTLGNFGSISNQGIEVVLSWKQTVNKDLSFNVTGNLTTYKNKVLEFGTYLPASESTPNQTQIGFPIGYFYGYEVEGIYQSYADKLKSPKVIGFDYGPGDLKYRDINNDGVINTDDRKMIGNPTPDFTYGGSITINYKSFDFGVDLQGSYGAEVYRVWGASELPYSRYNYAELKLDRWHGEGTSNWVPRLGDKFAINRLPSSFGIEDGSYLRIRNLQLGYNFNKNMISKVKMKNLRVYVNVQNLKTFKNNSGYAPEFGGGPTNFGIDYGNGAIPVVYTAGLNVTF